MAWAENTEWVSPNILYQWAWTRLMPITEGLDHIFYLFI